MGIAVIPGFTLVSSAGGAKQDVRTPPQQPGLGFFQPDSWGQLFSLL